MWPMVPQWQIGCVSQVNSNVVGTMEAAVALLLRACPSPVVKLDRDYRSADDLLLVLVSQIQKMTVAIRRFKSL